MSMPNIDLEYLTRVIRSAFIANTAADPQPANRELVARGYELCQIGYEGSGSVLGTQTPFIGPFLPSLDPRFPFYFGQFTYAARCLSGAAAAGDFIELAAQAPKSGGTGFTNTYARRVSFGGAVAAHQEVLNIETSIPLFFQNFRSVGTGVGTMQYYETFSFNGIRILWG